MLPAVLETFRAVFQVNFLLEWATNSTTMCFCKQQSSTLRRWAFCRIQSLENDANLPVLLSRLWCGT